MRVVDEETRRVIQQNRIDGLEGDNLFENMMHEEGEDGGDDQWDDFAMSGSENDEKYFKTAKSKNRKEASGGGTQRKTRSQGQDLSKVLL